MKRKQKYHRPMFNQTALIWYLAHLVLVLLGLLLYGAASVDWLNEPLKSGVASSLFATGICGAVLYVYNLQNERRRAALVAIEEAGLYNVFPGRSVSIRHEYADRIKAARTIDVIGFGLSHFRQDYVDKFDEFAKTKKIRILIANPDYPSKQSNYCNQRDKEEGNAAGQIAREVAKFLEDTAAVREAFPTSFQVRRLRMLPSINVFKMDGDILWGPYLVGDQSRNMPTFLVRDRGFLGVALQSHFEKIWNDDELSEAV